MLRRVSFVVTCLAGLCALPAFASDGPAAPGGPDKLPTFFVAPDAPAVLRQIAARFEVLRRVDGGYEVAVPAGSEAEIHRLDPEARRMRPDLHAGLGTAAPVATGEERLKALAGRYRGEAQLASYGLSAEGRREWVLTTAAGADRPDPAKPELLITAATHGDEVLATEVLLGVVETLLKAHGTDPRLTRLLDETVVHWVPVVCVDAQARVARNTGGVDPERDFPSPEDPRHVPASGCVKDLIAYAQRLPQLRGTLALRAGARLIAFPWSYTQARVPGADYAVLDRLATRMAAASGYPHGEAAAQLDVAAGSGADFFYSQRQTLSLAFWVHPSLAPLPAAVTAALADAAEPTWRFLEQVGAARD